MHTLGRTLFSTCRELSGRELVAEMVFTFLLPRVEKQTLRQRGASGVLAWQLTAWYNCSVVVLCNTLLIIGYSNSHLVQPAVLSVCTFSLRIVFMTFVLEFGCSYNNIIVTWPHTHTHTYSAPQSALPFTSCPQNSPPTEGHCDERRRNRNHRGQQRATITEWNSAMCACCILPYYC